MPVTKEKKQELVNDILAEVRKSQVVYVTNYQGMATAQLNALRGKLRAVNAGYHVVKNTLAARALQDAGLPVPSDMLVGPVALGFAYDDIGAPTKALMDFARENDKFQLKGAILGQQILKGKDAETLATMPGLPVLRAQLLGLISAPASRLVGVVAGSVRQVVNVVSAYAKKDEAAAAPAAV
ncbi:MAG: 50S ribosomal protein L10 [Chloroflexota bacterium]